MKVFQVKAGLCHWDASSICPTAAAAATRFPGLTFVDAPDVVFEGWGYDASQTGDARFIKPIAPDGWHYDDVSGTFYPDAEPVPAPTLAEQIADQQELAVDHEYRLTMLELGVE